MGVPWWGADSSMWGIWLIVLFAILGFDVTCPLIAVRCPEWPGVAGLRAPLICATGVDTHLGEGVEREGSQPLGLGFTAGFRTTAHFGRSWD